MGSAFAIAYEEYVQQPTGIEFISRYGLSGTSTIKRTLEALIEKEMIYPSYEDDLSTYRVYDVFLSRWLSRKMR